MHISNIAPISSNGKLISGILQDISYKVQKEEQSYS